MTLSRRNAWYKNIVKKYGIEKILIGKIDCSSEEIAFELEKGLIKCLRSSGVVLCNLTKGGEGTSGLTPSNKGVSMPEEQRRKVSESRKGKCLGNAHTKGHKLTEEHKEKLRIALRGHVARPAGWKMSDEQKAKISKANKGKKLSQEHIEILRAATKSRIVSDETRKKMSESAKNYVHVGYPHTLECKERMSRARKGIPWTSVRRSAQKKEK